MTSIRIDDDTDDHGDYLALEDVDETDLPGYVYLFAVNPSWDDSASLYIPIKALREALDKIEAEA